jgi:penicillin-binding protein 2
MAGTFHQTRLVQQVQAVDGQLVTAYDVRIKEQVDIDKVVMSNIRKGMVNVVNGAGGTAHEAQVANVEMAGKTGTAEWGPKKEKKDAAWFAGFCPAHNPKYAFAVVYEGEAGVSTHGGTVCAPLVGKVMKELFKGVKPEKKHKDEDEESDDDTDSTPKHRSHDDDNPPLPPPAPKKAPSVPFWKKWFGGMRNETPARHGEHLLCVDFGACKWVGSDAMAARRSIAAVT